MVWASRRRGALSHRPVEAATEVPEHLPRRVVARRAPAGLLGALADDTDLLVRWRRGR